MKRRLLCGAQADPVLHLHRRRTSAADHRTFTPSAWVISTNVSAYLLRDGYDDMVNYAGLAANAAASEVGRNPATAAETVARPQECQQREPAIPPDVDRLRPDTDGVRRWCGPAGSGPHDGPRQHPRLADEHVRPSSERPRRRRRSAAAT